MKTKWTNWSNTVTSTPDNIFYPSTEPEIISLVKEAISKNIKIKIIGSGHSCSNIAQTDTGYLIDLKNYNNIISFNKQENVLVVESGINLKDISYFLDKNGAALDNLGTINVQTISGAISTGTHGTGLNHGSVDQQVLSVKYINGLGEVKTIDSNSEDLFKAIRVGLGALGVILCVKIKVVDKFDLTVKTSQLSFTDMLTDFSEVGKHDHIRYWWAPHTDKVQKWVAKRNDTKSYTLKKNYFDGLKISNFIFELTQFKGVIFPFLRKYLNNFLFDLLLSKDTIQKGTSHSLFKMSSVINQVVMEYCVPYDEADKVLNDIKNYIDQTQEHVHLPVEVRFVPSNDAFLSMANNRIACYIGVIKYKPFGLKLDYSKTFKGLHNVFKKYKGRPHWGKKQFYSSLEIKELYPEWNKFKSIKEAEDPNKIFENKLLKDIFS